MMPAPMYDRRSYVVPCFSFYYYLLLNTFVLRTFLLTKYNQWRITRDIIKRWKLAIKMI